MAETPDKETKTAAEEVARELYGTLHHPRAAEIFANEWVQDSSLPIPSIRAIARRFLEALLLRALLHRDVATLRGLADAVEGSAPQPPVTNRIASEICGWLPRLSSELKREPTKGAMKAFLTEMYPYFADANATTWSDAWKLAGWSTDNDRKGPRNHDDAVALAKRLK